MTAFYIGPLFAPVNLSRAIATSDIRRFAFTPAGRVDLAKLVACEPARAWAAAHVTDEEAWNACPDGDWLLWFAAVVGVERTILLNAAIAVASRALGCVEPDEATVLREVFEHVEQWQVTDGRLLDVEDSGVEAFKMEDRLKERDFSAGRYAASAVASVASIACDLVKGKTGEDACTVCAEVVLARARDRLDEASERALCRDVVFRSLPWKVALAAFERRVG